MPSNLFRGFSEFVSQEEDKGDDDKGKFVSTVKKQLKVPKKLWLGMPILLSNVKLGKHKVTTPTMFYVSDFDDDSVTLTNALEVGQPEDSTDEDDPDNEIDLDKNNIDGRVKITISREDFEGLQQPQTFQGMDPTQLRPPGGGM